MQPLNDKTITSTGVVNVESGTDLERVELLGLPECPGLSCKYRKTGGCRIPAAVIRESRSCELLRVYIDTIREILNTDYALLSDADHLYIGTCLIPLYLVRARIQLEIQHHPIQNMSKWSGEVIPAKILHEMRATDQEIRRSHVLLDRAKIRRSISARRGGMKAAGMGSGNSHAALIGV
jgi:hypothetical protein